MAIGDNNSVPLGQAGTGAAFVLGDSQVANQFVANQARNQQIAYQNQLAKQKEALANAKLYQDNQLKLKGGLLWQNDINQLAQQDLNQGSQLMANGINPYRLNYNDPTQVQKGTDFLMQREGIKAKNDQRLALISEAQKQQANIQKTPELYEPDDILKFNQWQAGSLDDALSNPIPQVRPKFQPNKDLVPLLDPITFQTSKVVGNTKIAENKMLVEPTRSNIETLINGNESGKRWIKRETGLTPSEAKNIPSTFEDNKKDLLKQYKGDPSFRESLAKEYGITGEGQALDDILNQQAQQNTLSKLKYDSLINQYLNVAKGKANEFLKTNPDFTIEDQAMQRRGLQLREQDNARAASNATGDIGVPQEFTITYGDKNSANVTIPDYVPLTKSKMNFAGSPTIDLRTGKAGEKLQSSSDYELVGAGNVPIIVSGNMKGAIAQPNFAKNNPSAISYQPMLHVQLPPKRTGGKVIDQFIPYDRLPANIKNTKSIKEALNGFTPASGRTQSGTPSKVTKIQNGGLNDL